MDTTLRVWLNSSEKRSIIAQLFLKAVMSNSIKQFYVVATALSALRMRRAKKRLTHSWPSKLKFRL